MRILLALPPAAAAKKLPAGDQPGDQHGDQRGNFSASVLQKVLYKLSAIARKHLRLAQSSQTLRHVAEQIDALYWEAALDRKGGDVGPELAVLRAGVDFRPREWFPPFPMRMRVGIANGWRGWNGCVLCLFLSRYMQSEGS